MLSDSALVWKRASVLWDEIIKYVEELLSSECLGIYGL